MTEPINAVLISGEIDRDRMYRALGELAEIAAKEAQSRKPVVVVDSMGGHIEPTCGFLDSVLEDIQTRRSLEQADVKIYNAQSAAAVIALSIGRRRTMAAGTELVVHLPLATVQFDGAGMDGRLYRPEGPAHWVERTLGLMSRYGLDGPAQRSQLFSAGWLRLSADECHERGLVSELFRLESGDASSIESRCPASRPVNGDGSPVRVILISGPLTKAVLDRVLLEMRDLAACSNEDEEVTFLVDSSEAEMFSIDEFLESVQREPQLQRLAEKSSVKIYCAQVGAALLAFSLGCRHELARDSKVVFTLGSLTLQVGNPEQIDSDWRISPARMEPWLRHRRMVHDVVKRRGMGDLTVELAAAGRIELPAEECLRRGLVARLF